MKDFYNIKLIQQKRDNDCGVAVISMLSGVKYFEVKRKLIQTKIIHPDYCYMNFRQIKHGLVLFNINVKYRRKFSRWRDIQNTSIVSTNYTQNRKYWHWVLFIRLMDDRFIIDPNHTKIIKDFRGRESGCYIEICKTK